MPTQSYIRIVDGWPTLDIGALRHSITIQVLAPASPPSFDAAGPAMEWRTFTTALAAINPISGKDMIKAGQATTQLRLEVAIWYQPGILPSMRVLAENGSRYVIESIENVLEMNVALVLNCLGLGANE